MLRWSQVCRLHLCTHIYWLASVRSISPPYLSTHSDSWQRTIRSNRDAVAILERAIARVAQSNKIAIREKGLCDSAHVSSVINTVCTAGRPDVRAVNVWSQWYHGLMDHPAQQCIHSSLIRLPETDLSGQVAHTLVCRVVLLVRPIAAGLRDAAN